MTLTDKYEGIVEAIGSKLVDSHIVILDKADALLGYKFDQFSLSPTIQIVRHNKMNIYSGSDFDDVTGNDPISSPEKGNDLKHVPSKVEGETFDLHRTTTHRGLKSRHAQMLALGGTIGTGLFVGSGQALQQGGPVFLVIAYCLLTFLVLGIVTATTEIGSYLPVPGCSVAYYAHRFVSPSMGFALGWMYWYIFTITVPAEITAASLVVEYWNPPVNIAVWITIFIILIIILNLLPVRIYGEAEFWFASLKVLGIIGLLIMAFVLILGGGPTHDRLGFRYWKDPGPVKEYVADGVTGRFVAFISVTTLSVFAFGFAPELLVVTGGEMQRPRENLPKAGKRYFYRLVAFYILGSFAISMIISSDNKQLLGGGSGADASPWAIAVKEASIPVLDSIINAIILTSAISSGTSYLYMSSCALYSLAVAGNAPKIFARCTRKGVPSYALATSAIFSVLSYLNLSATGAVVFNWFVNLINTGAYLSWICVCLIYLRFRKITTAQGIRPETLPYRSILQPYMAYISGGIFSFLLLVNGMANLFPGHWDTSTFITCYIGIVILLGFYTVHRLTRGRNDRWMRPLHEVDTRSGLEEILADEQLESPLRPGKRFQVWRYLWE